MVGTVTSIASIAGDFTRRQPIAAEAAAISEVLGTPTATVGVAGVLDAFSDASGTLTKTMLLSGIVDTVSTVVGKLQQQETLSVRMGGTEILLEYGTLFYKYNGIEYPVGFGHKVDGSEIVYWYPE